LLENEPDLQADILVKGRHERDLSGTAAFLEAVQPQAVICAAPSFGQNAAASVAWQKSVTARGIILFAQEKCGAVQLELSAQGPFALRGFSNAQTFRSRAR
ncbi:MAG: hypothetical protein V4710_09390, partial [Verrucomicrobiota bacterium]